MIKLDIKKQKVGWTKKLENPAQFQHYQIRGSADKEDEGVQWEAICDCFPSEDEENEEELRRLALSTGQIIMDNNCICTHLTILSDIVLMYVMANQMLFFNSKSQINHIFKD